MKSDLKIRDLFVSDITRDIPPVVYFHEQSPDKLAAEVSEYIITGGWPEEHPNHRRVPSGIHEQYLRLLRGICAGLEKTGGPNLPNAWISGFYGSGKSSFAKLLGLALDGVALPSGGSLAEAWLARDTSPKAQELHNAWSALRQKVEPIAVVFDVGSIARDGEHIHAAAVRQVQRRLGYASTEPLVADFELRLERDKEWARFEQVAEETLGAPWSEVKGRALVEEDFSLVMSVMYPERYTDPMSWFTSRGGTHARADSPEEAATAISDMLKARRPEATLFLVIDEVSQYMLANQDRVDRMRAFATALGATLKGKAWLLALGQQKLEEQADDDSLGWAKGRFPPELRVHLAATNIRDVVHQRLLRKRPEAEGQLKALFEQHRAELRLHAYGCDAVTPDEFAEVYPMLPGQIDLILQITSALRTRSTRAQGDDQAIRGLLQLLGELFRDRALAEEPVGTLVTLDHIYDVQHTALDSDVQASMARLMAQVTDDSSGLMVRVAKVVALLELIQETQATDAKLVAQCLYRVVGGGGQLGVISEALEGLRRKNLLSYSEKLGYKIQSSAGEEWEKERHDIGVPGEAISESVQQALKLLLEAPERPSLMGRSFPWAARFSDERRADDVSLLDPRDDAALVVDFRLTKAEPEPAVWIRKSGESAFRDRLVWQCSLTGELEHLARELHRSSALVNKYKPRRESLSAARKLLLQQEENRKEDLTARVHEAVRDAWMAGALYFRGRKIIPREHGASFAKALHAVGVSVLPSLFPSFVPTQVQPSELMQLADPRGNEFLTGPPSKFLGDELGILELDKGRYVAKCDGVAPRRILEHLVAEGGASGGALLSHFGSPPYGYTANVVKACVLGQLRALKLKIVPDGGKEITATRDEGTRELFEKERAFRRATLFPAGEDDIGVTARAKIAQFFEERLGLIMDRDDHAIADAVAEHFPRLAQELREVQERLGQLPGSPEGPAELTKLAGALERCVRGCRQTQPTVREVKRSLDALRDGLVLLQLYRAELTQAAVSAVNAAHQVLQYQAAQLTEIGAQATNVEAAITRVQAQLQGERPWRELSSVEADLEEIRRAYVAERQRLLGWQEREAEAARARLKVRAGFSTLTGEQSHQVLRPFATALTSTSAEAIAPSLIALKDPFTLALTRAEERANDLLDELLSQGQRPLIARVDLQLRNRELTTEAEVRALVHEVEERLLEQVRAGARVRLL